MFMKRVMMISDPLVWKYFEIDLGRHHPGHHHLQKPMLAEQAFIAIASFHAGGALGVSTVRSRAHSNPITRISRKKRYPRTPAWLEKSA